MQPLHWSERWNDKRDASSAQAPNLVSNTVGSSSSYLRPFTHHISVRMDERRCAIRQRAQPKSEQWAKERDREEAVFLILVQCISHHPPPYNPANFLNGHLNNFPLTPQKIPRQNQQFLCLSLALSLVPLNKTHTTNHIIKVHKIIIYTCSHVLKCTLHNFVFFLSPLYLQKTSHHDKNLRIQR